MKQKSNSSISKNEQARQKRADKMIADIQAGTLKVYSGETAINAIKQQNVSVSSESME